MIARAVDKMPGSQKARDVSSSRFVIGGDFCPVNANEPPCARGDVDAVFDGLLDVSRGADVFVVNLETPLIERQSPIKKSGPVIGARREAARILSATGIHAVSLANNHIMDHGAIGLASTISALEQQGIAFFGAGPDLSSAQKILVREVDGLRIGLLGVTHHEFSVADSRTPGAAPMDPVEVHRQVAEQRENWDVLVALVHAGAENYRFPSPGLQKYCRFLVDLGASVVVCQHSHCAGAYERYKGALVVYGQGNLLFDWPNKPREWFEGFLVDLELTRHGVSSFKLIPYERGEAGTGVRSMGQYRVTEFLRGIEERSRSIKDPSFVERKWTDFFEKQANIYYQTMLGGRFPVKVVRKLFDALDRKMVPFSEKHRLRLLNMIRCETHREALALLLSAETHEAKNSQDLSGRRPLLLKRLIRLHWPRTPFRPRTI